MGDTGRYSLLLLISLIIFSCANPKSDTRPILDSSKLPKRDLSGRRIDPASFTGKFIYLQFLKTLDSSKNKRDNEILNTISDMKKTVSIIVFSEDPKGGFSKLTKPTVYFCLDNTQSIKKSYSGLACCDGYIIYGQDTSLIWSDLTRNVSMGAALPYLLEIERSEGFRRFDASYVLSQVHDRGMAAEVTEYLKNSGPIKTCCIIALIDNLCETCSSGKVVRLLGDYARKADSTLNTHLFLSEHFSQADRENMSSEFNLAMPIHSAPHELLRVWKELRDRVPLLFDNLLLFIDSEARVIAATNTMNPEDALSLIETSLYKP